MKQPTAEDLGGVPGIAGARPVGTYDVDAYARGGHQISTADTRFGEDVSRLGEAEAELVARRARAEFTAAHSQATSGLMGLRGQRIADPDYKTLKPRWTDTAAKVVDGPAEMISDEPTRLAYYDSLHAPLMQEARDVSQQVFRGAADAHAANREEHLTQLEQNLSTDPEDTLSAAATDSLHFMIDDAVDKRFLTPEQASIEKKAAALRLTAATYRRMAQEDPARAVDELTAEEGPHPLVPSLPDHIRAGLVAQAQLNVRAREIDDERDTFLAERARRSATAESRDNYVKLALAGEPGLAFRVANDDTLAHEDKQRVLDTAARSVNDDPPPSTSNATTLNFLDRIRRDVGDPERLTDPNELLDTYNRQELSAEHYSFLRKQLDDARNPEGALLAAKARLFMRAFKPLVDPERPDAEAAAATQTLLVERALAGRTERMRGDGNDPGDLFDASKKGYVHSAFDLIPQFVHTQPDNETTPKDKLSTVDLAPSGQDSRTSQPLSAAQVADQPPNDHHQSGFIKSTITRALAGMGLDPSKAHLAAEAITLGASLLPPVGAALAIDDLLAAIRNNDRVGMISAMVNLMPAGRAAALLKLAASVAPRPNASKRGLRPTTETAPAPEENAAPSPSPKPPSSAPERLSNAGLDRYMPKLDPEKVAAALKRGTAREVAGGIGFRSHRIFKRTVLDAPPDTESHHLVEQRETNPQDPYLVHHNHNVLYLPKRTHAKVSGFYSSKQEGSDKTVREHLTDLPFDTQHERGVNIINKLIEPDDAGAP